MKIVRSRSDLMELVARLAPTNACARAVREGRVVNHGAFLTEFGKGWVLTAHSQSRKWVILVYRGGGCGWCMASLISIPWEKYIGGNGIYGGDNPVDGAYQSVCAGRRTPISKHEAEKKEGAD